MGPMTYHSCLICGDFYKIDPAAPSPELCNDCQNPYETD